MNRARPGESALQNPLRLWPGIVAVTLLWIVRFGVPIVWPDALAYCVLGEFVGALAIIVWWLFFSRARGLERWGALPLIILAMFATTRILHISVSTGMMGMMFPIVAIPALCLAFVVWAVATRGLSEALRRATMVATILLSCGAFALVRTDGIGGNAKSYLAWRWAETAEDRLLAHANDEPAANAASSPMVASVKSPAQAGNELAPIVPASAPPAEAKTPARESPAATPTREPMTREPAPAVKTAAANTGTGWPGFRGPTRNGTVPGVQIDSDWAKSPPVEMWRRPVGPGWSSFAVAGDLLFTQEQRGGDEVISCYLVSTGEPVWRHRDVARFWESNAGAGPRGTPTLSNGRVYTFGATGIVNALDASSGAVIWSRNAGSDTGTKIPEWGFASSPLVVDDIVVVAAAGKLVAYDVSTGKPRWFGPDGEYGYSSPQPVTIEGVSQILLMSSPGVTSVSPADGKRLWELALPQGMRIVQPAVIADGDILAAEGEGHPIHRIVVTHGPGSSGWVAEDRWTSLGLKPYFNDFVVHNGSAFGVDGAILSCIDLKDGKRRWKGGRYGGGQLVLLPGQDLLLVLSEEGELALVAATADRFTELARVPAITGKTWNHPVLAGNVLLVRNGQEMAAFRLTLARR